ncbi:MAG: hypothetical protein KKE51_10255 [Gammaproteobacteria bacterium]|nr:hypothetical protein [Gammaproteobacteria bacterium]MBU1602748.1 hypothetical protein [Gammaproteobacteria bacterium]MBU2432420.1 hypothetical protein [Gammaproteobacteria bacterium]MBU2449080.1 hypothetical protein [Gammaproteobacteria bacterium]
MRTRTQYIPVSEAEAGMTLAAPLNVIKHRQTRFSLPAGHMLTPDNLRQLTANRAEFIFIAEPDTRSDEQIAQDTALVAGRIMEIFSDADLGDPTTMALFDQILAYRSS